MFKFVNKKEALKHYNISSTHLHRLVGEGKISVKKISERKFLYDISKSLERKISRDKQKSINDIPFCLINVLDRIPFTYVVKHKPSGMWYYGVKYGEGCHPNDLWTTYFTSSLYVHELIKKDGKDSFVYEIRKCFNDITSAINWEKKVLKKIINRPNNINRNVFGSTFCDKPDINGDTPRLKLQKCMSNRIWINNGVERKFVDPDNIPDGFQVGWLSTSNTTEKKKKAHKGKVWVNNGTESKFVFPDNIPNGYIMGRLYHVSSEHIKKIQSERSKGKVFVNNGNIETRVYKDEIPEAFVLGRLSKMS